MGTGKTTIAKKLAHKSGFSYVSTDALIEQDEKMSISDIFSKKGEPYFRAAERNAVKKAAAMSGAVIDAGGGAVTAPENLAELKRDGILVCLWADPKDIYDRTKGFTHRPLLQVENPLEKISELLDKRKPYYERADHHINTSAMSIDEAVESILKMIKQGTGYGVQGTGKK